MKAQATRSFKDGLINRTQYEVIDGSEEKILSLLGKGLVELLPMLPSELERIMSGMPIPSNGLRGILHTFTSNLSTYQNSELVSATIFVITLNGETIFDSAVLDPVTGTITSQFTTGDDLLIIFQ